jgi:microcystin-dependent protein
MVTTPPPLERRHFLARLFGALVAGTWLGRPSRAEAASSQDDGQPYLGEIRMFAGDFEPYGWRFCDGRLLPISEYEALFALLGTTYGGDGEATFALPDMRGRIPFHPYTMQLGEMRGVESVTVIPTQMPLHSHELQGTSGPGFSSDPSGTVPARNALGSPHYSLGGDTSLAAGALDIAGGSQPHDNLMPSLGVHFIIAVYGVFPQQS